MNKPKYVVVVGIDYSGASERALDEAFTLASYKPGAQLHIANVRSPSPVVLAGIPLPLPPWAEWQTELREYVARRVAAFQATAGVTPFKHLYTHQRMSDPAHGLAQLAADVEADLVVVGTHDWHGASRLLLGSVAEAVSRLAPCPVLIVRRKAVPPPVPAIQPPCPACVATRQATHDATLWCEQHSEHHGRPHTYHQGDRVGDPTNFPLVGEG
ncbi:MAG: universal stress protein [Polyangiaceae bacterium]